MVKDSDAGLKLDDFLGIKRELKTDVTGQK